MKLLLTLGDKNVLRDYKVRKAARAVVFDKEGKVALLYVSKHGYHKLPGGGIDEGESIIEALKRECLEEIGCDVEVAAEVGEIIEYRHFPDERDEEQESFSYIANVTSKKGEPRFEQDEIDDGFEVQWVNPETAVELLKKGRPKTNDGPFIVSRDFKIIEEAMKIV
ncbi:MAG: NUDIX domain-containing protein [Patescibacteria group bacterium]|nr:NUDIX domain-containing protein [Patescibacteria group bacterium]MDE2015484.1 NUDIX domain-containing protein [Patescibacteria group bacterium]MDE2226900.1 NUDIX domain-containing protein [Patescibacteria group bacterium]